MKSSGAGYLHGVSVNAVVEDVADGRLGVGEEAVAAGAQGVGVGLLCKQTTRRLINKTVTNSSFT